eukprot:TRINITY_DN182_c0_g1_i1.p1 TRINITY_DN182_c0_g1~~TRINITY_DN182_c0_g1_i1.p1  ORF type:complete len:297 (+),score=88.87 TRINITY_DN182_c0_g1_i1:702-1592(+)
MHVAGLLFNGKRRRSKPAGTAAAGEAGVAEQRQRPSPSAAALSAAPEPRRPLVFGIEAATGQPAESEARRAKRAQRFGQAEPAAALTASLFADLDREHRDKRAKLSEDGQQPAEPQAPSRMIRLGSGTRSASVPQLALGNKSKVKADLLSRKGKKVKKDGKDFKDKPRRRKDKAGKRQHSQQQPQPTDKRQHEQRDEQPWQPNKRQRSQPEPVPVPVPDTQLRAPTAPATAVVAGPPAAADRAEPAVVVADPPAAGSAAGSTAVKPPNFSAIRAKNKYFKTKEKINRKQIISRLLI